MHETPHKGEAPSSGQREKKQAPFFPLGAIFEDVGRIMGTKHAPMNLGHSGTGPLLCVAQCFSGEKALVTLQL